MCMSLLILKGFVGGVGEGYGMCGREDEEKELY